MELSRIPSTVKQQFEISILNIKQCSLSTTTAGARAGTSISKVVMKVVSRKHHHNNSWRKSRNINYQIGDKGSIKKASPLPNAASPSATATISAVCAHFLLDIKHQ